MAKSKSRRARRQDREKQRQQSPITATVETEITEPAIVETVTPEPVARKAINFVQEYFYVYTDLRSMLVIAVVLFVVMVGLLYAI